LASDDFYKEKVWQKKMFVNFILVLNMEYANTDQQITHCLSLKETRNVSTKVLFFFQSDQFSAEFVEEVLIFLVVGRADRILDPAVAEVLPAVLNCRVVL
jgi:hypothetical protein